MAPEADSKKCGCCTGPGTKEAPGEEVAPWNSSAAGNPPLSKDNRALHPQGSLSSVNKIHALYVKDVEELIVHMSQMSKII